MMNVRCILLLLLLWLTHTSGSAQQAYTWHATVPAPAQKGYHSILLTPEVTGRLAADLSDIRLYDAQQQEVPYLLRTEESLRQSQLFRPYSILQYQRQSGGLSELLIENPQQRKISNLSLLIKNADVQKQVSLSGSDNREDWYVLKAHDVLHAISSTENTAKMKLLEFPLNDYRYLRLQLNDSASAPLNILQAGYYDTQTEAGKYAAIPVQISRTDSTATRQTYIRLRFAQPAYPEQLELEITAPDLYLRHGHVLSDRPATTGKRRSRPTEAAITRVPFTLSSNEPARIQLPRHRVQQLTIVIENEDNPPLNIAQVTPLQLNRYLVAKLEEGEAYTLYFGNEDAAAPVYDLRFFSDSIPANLPVLTPINVQAVVRQKEGGILSSKLLVWAAIGLVVAGLGYMTVRLLNEMNREKQ